MSIDDQDIKWTNVIQAKCRKWLRSSGWVSHKIDPPVELKKDVVYEFKIEDGEIVISEVQIDSGN